MKLKLNEKEAIISIYHACMNGAQNFKIRSYATEIASWVIFQRKHMEYTFFFFLHIPSNIREYGSTLYVGLARAVSPTNTNFRLTFLLTRLQEALYEDLAV